MNLSLLHPSLSGLLSGVLLSTVLLGACWLFYQLLLRHERCFHFNRRFLLYTPWLVLVVPPLLGAASPWLASWRQSWASAASSAEGLLTGGMLPGVTIESDSPLSTADGGYWLLVVYGAGVLVLLGHRAWQLLHLWHLARTWPREARAGYTLAYTGGQRPVSSFGRLIFWDETTELAPAEAAQVLRHEVAHMQQHHSLERLSLELARGLLWFNPFVHFYPAALELTHELLADEQALGHPSPTAAEAYTTLLARVALRQLHPNLPVAHSFTQSFTLTRIRMLTTSSPIRRWKQWLLAPVGTSLLLLVACEKSAEKPEPSAAITLKEVTMATPSSESTPAPPPPPPPAFTYVEHMPEYPGGPEQLLADIGKAVVYPESAKAEKLEGRVFVRFIVGTDGTIQAAELQKGIGYNIKVPDGGGKPVVTKVVTPAAQAMNDMALNAVRNLPGKWKPGTQDGKPVAVFYTVPITFSLK
ncbi:M56 family metallopeptidase [Hymenobacter fodinae]|uniref:TonB family protein n=1 Tax=Hymenobacter fodinae TaxID=2510796 RepID=A0A4Z0P325_9BACT|nr:M56 family metallopeptidase [Hymenobacter fodinae]TGE05410.1 hypothetical protein EU556_19075 [Hymenobacter fodinae]